MILGSLHIPQFKGLGFFGNRTVNSRALNSNSTSFGPVSHHGAVGAVGGAEGIVAVDVRQLPAACRQDVRFRFSGLGFPERDTGEMRVDVRQLIDSFGFLLPYWDIVERHE